ncbi:Chaperone protein dnaJ C76, chloroplastic [Linum grandiflorum]
MATLAFCYSPIPPILLPRHSTNLRNSTPRNSIRFNRSSKFALRCTADDNSSSSSPHAVLGVDPGCSAAELKAAFRAKVKQFHPDVIGSGEKGSDVMIRRVIRAYEILSDYTRSEIIERECMDPFENPECEAYDLFVNEVCCIGKGCPYSCVERAPQAFTFSPFGTARVKSQGYSGDYQVQMAAGQCPRSCIHYVTPSQRIILEESLDSILNEH